MVYRIKLLFILLIGFFSILAFCQESKRIYIANDNHTDYMWSADEETYRQALIEMIDYYLNLADLTANEATEYQSRFNCDGSFWVWIYEKNKSTSEFERLINRIKSGHISVPLTLLNICYGGIPAEAVLRSMYYAGQIERKYDLRFRLALAMENQTLPYGLGGLWSGSGAEYSWKGICGCASRIPDAWDREHDIYWWVGADNSKILMKWNSMLRNSSDIGGYAEAHGIPEVINFVDTNSSFISRYPYKIIGVFGYGGDAVKELTDKFVQVAKQESTPERKVIVSNELDFFEDFEKNYGNNLPSLSCSFGNEWDLLCASMAEVSARVKRAVEKLRAAEAMATLVRLQDPLFMIGQQEEREKAWLNLGLYWEHAWTADGSIISRDSRAKWQRQVARGVEYYVNKLYQEAANSLGQMIRKEGNETRFYVFNPLSWPRTDIADFLYSGSDKIHVIDLSTEQESPSQVVYLEEKKYLRVLAENVPSVGYKVYEIDPGEGRPFDGSLKVSKNTIENSFYKVTVADNGAVSSIIDKSHDNRQIVREINSRMINDLGPGLGTLEIENNGPVSVTLKANSTAPLAHSTYITLFRDSKRIDIRNEIKQNFSDVYTWDFGFDLNSPDVWHEEVGAIINAKLLEQGGHYSSRNARYDWLTLNHFADISSGQFGITLSNADCYFMKLGNSTTEYLDIYTPLISVLAGGQVDGGSLGIPNQGNDDYFLQRFALQTHDAFDPVVAMRFAMEHQNPFVTGEVKGGTKYPNSSYSLLEIDNTDVFLWALKPAEEVFGTGVIARVWNMSSKPTNFAIKPSSYSILDAKRTTHIETPIEKANYEGDMLTSSISACQLQTYYLKFNRVPLLGKKIRKKK